MKTLTVGQLIEILQKVDKNKPVLVPYNEENAYMTPFNLDVIMAGHDEENQTSILYEDIEDLDIQLAETEEYILIC